MRSHLIMTEAPRVHVWKCLECMSPLAELTGRGNLLVPSGKLLTFCKTGVWVPCDCGKGRLWEFRK